MPRFNREGPRGKGSMTGKGLGLCNNNKTEDNIESTKICRRQGRRNGFSCKRRGQMNYFNSISEEIKFLEERLAEIRNLKTD